MYALNLEMDIKIYIALILHVFISFRERTRNFMKLFAVAHHHWPPNLCTHLHIYMSYSLNECVHLIMKYL